MQSCSQVDGDAVARRVGVLLGDIAFNEAVRNLYGYQIRNGTQTFWRLG
jgi:hypothetical protein